LSVVSTCAGLFLFCEKPVDFSLPRFLFFITPVLNKWSENALRYPSDKHYSKRKTAVLTRLADWGRGKHSPSAGLLCAMFPTALRNKRLRPLTFSLQKRRFFFGSIPYFRGRRKRFVLQLHPYPYPLDYHGVVLILSLKTPIVLILVLFRTCIYSFIHF
jgi:hypothetical protein